MRSQHRKNEDKFLDYLCFLVCGKKPHPIRPERPPRPPIKFGSLNIVLGALCDQEKSRRASANESKEGMGVHHQRSVCVQNAGSKLQLDPTRSNVRRQRTRLFATPGSVFREHQERSCRMII